MLGGLALFGVVFALNSSVHSYLVLAYSESDRVSLSVGLLLHGERLRATARDPSLGVLYQFGGVSASLWGAVVLAAAAGLGRCSCRRSRARSTGAEQKGTTDLRVAATAGVGGSQMKV